MDTRRVHDTVVIGAGPAGLTAAIYLRRFLRDVVVVHRGASRAEWIPRSHNFPGFVGGVSGAELLARLRAQLDAFGGKVVEGSVSSLRRHDDLFVAEINETQLSARCVVLATGVVDLNPALEGIEKVREAGLLRQCPVCDGYEFRQQKMAVLGDSEHALREALFLRRYASEIAIVSGSAALQSADLINECAQAGMPFFGSATAAELADRTGTRVEFRFADLATRAFDVVYSACGATVQSALATSLGAEVNHLGRVIVDAHCETKVQGLFAAGDVVEGLSQLVVASAHGAIAATAIHNRLLQDGI